MDNQENKPQADSGNVQTSPGQNIIAPLKESSQQVVNSTAGDSSQLKIQPNSGEFKQDSPTHASPSNFMEASGQSGNPNQSSFNLDDYTPDFKSPENKNSNSDAKAGNSSPEEKSSRTGTIITIILIAIIVIGIWQTNNDNKGQTGNNNENNATIVVDSTKEDGSVTIIDGNNGNSNTNVDVSGETVKITAYYNKIGTNECENVAPLERIAEKKYSSDIINTVRGLLTPLNEKEVASGWLSSIPGDTYLKNVVIKDGVAQVVFSSALNKVAGSCRVLAIRSQIEKTLLQFSYIKSVTICIDDNCRQDEILQP